MRACAECNKETPVNGITCPDCEAFIGYPNVRAAESEFDKLNDRYEASQSSIILRGLESVARDFEEAMQGTAAIMVRSIHDVIALASSNSSFLTFGKSVAANVRNVVDNEYDQVRQSFEANIFPNYSEHIHYSILSLESSGYDCFGEIHCKLKTSMIEKRASLFEENPFKFFAKHEVLTHQKCPKGFRSTWGNRGVLSVAKLHQKLNAQSSAENYENILFSGNKNSADADYIEVHIYGNINLTNIESMEIKGDCPPSLLACFDAYRDSIQKKGILIKQAEAL